MNIDNYESSLEELQREVISLRQQNETYHHLASFPQLNPDPVFEYDRNGQVVYLNPGAQRVLTRLGLTEVQNFLPADFLEMFTAANDKPEACFVREVTIGESIFKETIFFPAEYGTLRIYAKDITQDKQMEKARQESEARFRLVLKNAPVTVAAQDKELRFIWAFNQRTVNPEEVIGKTDSEIFSPEVAAWTMGLKRQVLETGKELREQGWVTSGGQRLFLDLFLEPMCDKDGQIIGVGVATVDLTGIKLAEQALQVSEERYRSLFENMTEGFGIHEVIYDENGKPCDYRFLDVNPAFERLTGLKREHVLGKTYLEVLPDEGDSWVKMCGNVVLTGEPVQFENYSATLNRHYEVFAYRCAPNQFATIFMDITDRMKMEDELRINLTKYSVLFDTLPLGVTIADQNGQILESNQEASRLLGLSEEEQKHRRILEEEWHIVRPDRTPMPPEEYASVRALKEQRRVENVEMGIVKSKDKITWISVTASPLPLDNYGVVITYNDISQRIQAEEALHQAHEKLEITVEQRTKELRRISAYNRSLLESSLDALVTITPDGKIGDVNAVTEAFTGYSRATLIGTAFHSYFTNPEKARLVYEQVFKTGTVRDYKLELQHRDGHTTPVIYNAAVYRDESSHVAGVFAAARDITERKQAEQQLALLTTALEAAANGIIITDKQGMILWTNPAFNSMTGYAKDEILGQNPRFLKSSQQDPEFYHQLWDTILAGKIWHGELINQRKDGSFYAEEQTITPVHNEAGNITHFISIKQDITDHKRAEEEIRKSEQKYRSLVIATTQIVWQTNAAGEVVEDLPTWRAFTGQRVEEIMGQGWINAVHPADRQRTTEIWAHAVDMKTLYETEYRIKSHTGEYRHFAVRGVPVIDNEENISCWIGTCTDITEKKRIEAQLIHSEKHAVIGRMVGSVTHEINNPLQTVKNCLYLIKQEVPTDSPLEEPLRMATSEIQRLANLVAQLRQLYLPQQNLTVRPHELLDIIEEVHNLIIQHLENSHVIWHPMAGLQPCYVYCVRDQIIEVFLNICINAIEAMQTHGGTLSVDMVLPVDRIQAGVKFIDSGPGINPEIMEQLFEPFTTTKENGLGLGLSICYGIIQRHGGQLLVDSQPGEGTTFTIWLPLAVQGQERGE